MFSLWEYFHREKGEKGTHSQEILIKLLLKGGGHNVSKEGFEMVENWILVQDV